MEINNEKLINRAKSLYKQIFISTGATKLDEIKKLSKELQGDQFVLFHCVSSYPTPAANVNLPESILKKYFSR